MSDKNIVESIFSFVQYKPIPVTELVQMHFMRLTPNQDGFINFGWRGWEGIYLLLLYGIVPKIRLWMKEQ